MFLGARTLADRQNPSVLPVVETDATMGSQRKVTRRRRWHRPVYRDEPDHTAILGEGFALNK
jgi:hypothetical protein